MWSGCRRARRTREGEGSVSMRELVALSLRRRPDRIIVGECCGAGGVRHAAGDADRSSGSMTTVHANDPGNAISRFKRTMVLRRRRPQPRRHRPAGLPSRCRAAPVARRTHARRGPLSGPSIGAIDPLPRRAGSVIPRRAVRFRRRGLMRTYGPSRASGARAA